MKSEISDEAIWKAISGLAGCTIDPDDVEGSTQNLSPERRRSALESIERIRDLVELNRKTRMRVDGLQAELSEARQLNARLTDQNRELTNRVIHDLLTGLYTRWFVREKIEEEIERSARHALPTSVLMVDLDHFKRVNDSYGHLAGDTVLRDIGKVIRESLRTYDIPGRYGGEEFCLMLPITSADKTLFVAERIRSNIEDHQFEIDGNRFSITASIGVAELEDAYSVTDADQLIGLADQALYAAKSGGRNRIEVWQQPN